MFSPGEDKRHNEKLIQAVSQKWEILAMTIPPAQGNIFGLLEVSLGEPYTIRDNVLLKLNTERFARESIRQREGATVVAPLRRVFLWRSDVPGQSTSSNLSSTSTVFTE